MRPTLAPANRRSEIKLTRFTPAEAQKLQALATKRGMKISAILREATLATLNAH